MGVIEVRSGFKGFREVNHVTYDRRLISVQTMVKALVSAGTYIGVADD
jgi:peptide methionine sulfoxide reductase MsrA